MNLLIVSDQYPPEVGGIGTYTSHMAQALLQRGHRVTVVCGYETRPSVSEEGRLRIVRQLHMGGTVAAERGAQAAGLVSEEMRGTPIDVVEFPEFEGLGLEFQRSNPTVPTVVRLHAPTRVCHIGGAPPARALLRRFWLNRAGRAAERRERESLARADVVVSPSQWMLRTLVGWGWEIHDGKVVPNPFFDWPAPLDLAGRDYGSQQVLFLGRLSRLKGTHLVPEICSGVWTEIPTARFEVVGPDQPMDRRETWGEMLIRRTPERFRSRIDLRGAVRPRELPRYLQRHSIAVFASSVESFSYTLLECMQAGIACVVATGGGARELGEDGVSTLHVARDPAAISEAVVALLRDPQLRQRMGEAAQVRARSRFCGSVVAKQAETVYAAAIAKARR